MKINKFKILFFFILYFFTFAKVGYCDLNDGLIAYYPFNGTAYDESGNGIHGILNGDATFKEGKIDTCLYLDGDGDYVDLGDGFNIYQEFSLSVWINTQDISRKYPAILAKYETNRYGPYDFDLHYGKVNLWVSDGQGGNIKIDSNNTIEQNEWAHIAYTIKNNQLKIYINGILDITASIPSISQNSDRVTIGRQAFMFSPYSDLQFKGYLDDLRIYSRSITENEVQSIYNLVPKPSYQKNLIAYYPFDGSAQDESGNGIHGILKDNADFRNGRIEKSLYLDGDGDYVDLGNGLNINNFCTVTVWIKTEDISRKYPAILAKYETNHYGPYDFDLHFDKANLWVSDGKGGIKDVDSNNSIKENEWTHIAYVINNTNLKIYINGALDTEDTIPLLSQNDDKVTIGRQALMFSPYSNLQFKGYIDELRIYSTALTDEDILAIYNIDEKIPLSKGFVYPIAPPYLTETSDSDGWFNILDFLDVYKGGTHLGEDWNSNSGGNTDCGTTIHSIANGKVIHANYEGACWGNVIIIRHQLMNGKLIESLYGHLEEMIVETDDIVTKNQAIGYMGGYDRICFGASVSCHLHFEIRNDEKCSAWGEVGPGYSSNYIGWTDPSDIIDDNRTNIDLTSYSETKFNNVNDGQPLSFEFSNSISGNNESSITIDPPQAGGNITIIKYKNPPVLSINGVNIMNQYYDINGFNYSGGYPLDITISWTSPPPPAEVIENPALYVNFDGVDWLNAGSDHDISEITWKLTNSPYSVSFTANHLSQWAIGNKHIDLKDVILILKLLGGQNNIILPTYITDLKSDGKIGLSEAIYLLQIISDIRKM